MAPATRSGKRLSRDQVLAHQEALRYGHAVNTNGFPGLPAELLLEIFTYLPSLPIPCTSQRFASKLRERRETLVAMVQLCQNLRQVFLPILWSRIEVCASRYYKGVNGRLGPSSGPWVRDMATELVQQLEISTVRNPSLGTHVRVVNVFITHYSAKSVLKELVRCLALYPNLHTVQILGQRMPAAHWAPFSGKTFTGVRTLVTPSPEPQLLSSFPSISHLFLATEFPQNRELNQVSPVFQCSQLQEIRWFVTDFSASFGARERSWESVVKLLPNKCGVHFYTASQPTSSVFQDDSALGQPQVVRFDNNRGSSVAKLLPHIIIRNLHLLGPRYALPTNITSVPTLPFWEATSLNDGN